MQFDDFDKRIRDSAEHHHPPYNENAWEKMEKKLDEHMPEEKDDRRRFLFFILLLIGIGAGITWAVIRQPWNSGQQPVAVKTTPAKNTDELNTVQNSTESIKPETNDVAGTEPKTDIVSVETNEQKIPVDKVANERQQQKSVLPQSVMPEDEPESRTANQKATSVLAIKTNRKVQDKRTDNKTDVQSPVTGKTATPDNVAMINPDTVGNDGEKKVNEKADAVAAERMVEKEELVKPVETKTETARSDANNLPEQTVKKEETEKIVSKDAEAPLASNNISKSKKKSSFFISASAGPDISAAGTDRLGKMQLLSGAGFGYSYKDRLTLRTGFYTARKVYTASPEQYNPPPPFWSYYPYMEKIEADCKVYEIPLLLSYHFGRKSKSSWLATAGVSSYLMKEEVYDYYYKPNPTAPVRTYRRTIKEENDHFFSVLTLSAGYQRKLGNKISLIAEPYLKLPLTGVGYGKVKLNSAGMMMTVTINPFSHRK